MGQSSGASIGVNNPIRPPTRRQLEVLQARCESGSRKEAAALLGISPETVRWHLARLFERCCCVDEAQAGWRHHEELAAIPGARVRMKALLARVGRACHTEILSTIPIYEATHMALVDSFPASSYAGLACDDAGRSDDRPPLVLLHGLTFDRQMWRPALTELELLDPRRRIVSIDLPGHGGSPDAPSYSMDAIVEHVHSAVIEAGLEDPVIVGHSASAATATLYAAQYRTRGVVSVEGALRVADFAAMAQSLEPVLRGPGFDEAWGRITAKMFRTEEVAPKVQEFIRATSQARQEVVLGYWQPLFERTPAELDAWVVRAVGAIRESGVPYVSVLGQDPSAEDVAWLRTNLPEARTMVWPDSGHFPQLAHPRRFAELLAETATWAGQALATIATR